MERGRQEREKSAPLQKPQGRGHPFNFRACQELNPCELVEVGLQRADHLPQRGQRDGIIPSLLGEYMKDI